MLYVAIDPNDKNIVRGVYRLPSGMTFEHANQLIQTAYTQAAESPDNQQVDELLEKYDIQSQAFLVMEV